MEHLSRGFQAEQEYREEGIAVSWTALEAQVPTTSSHGTHDRNHAQGEKNPMHAVKNAESVRRIASCGIGELAVKEERLQYEQDDCEHEPYERHQVDPPKRRIEVASPGIHDMKHVEA